MPLLSLKNIKKSYERGGEYIPILIDINLDIEEGEYVAIMGPSGSGKSTLMNIIGGLDAPSSGIYQLDGRELQTMNDDELAEVRSKKIGFVFQSFNLLSRFTVLQNVIMPMRYNNDIPDNEREFRATQALKAAGFPEDRFMNKPSQLSGGQMQRVAIARALVNQPKILLADEPTGNLDSETGKVVMETFRKLNEQGRTIVLITHEQSIADYADRIIFIRDGIVTTEN